MSVAIGKFKVKDGTTSKVGFNSSVKDSFRIGGVFEIKCFDKDGNLKWIEKFHNFITNEGLNNHLDVMFGGVSQTDPWYMMLCGSGQKAVTDTMSSHAAWSEITAYDSTARPDYIVAAASSQSINNTGNAAVFNMNGTAEVYGAAIVSESDVGGTTGVLFCVADFDDWKRVGNGDTFNCTYTLNASDV